MIRRAIVIATLALLAASLPARGGIRHSLCDDIAKLDSDYHEYLPLKSRWQDEDKTKVDERLLRLRTKAIPRLISCLTDGRKTNVRGEIWGQPSVGMVAFAMLCDLFTAWQDGTTGFTYTIKGAISWDDLCSEGPDNVLYPCWAGWDKHLQKYGRQSIQQSWRKAWTKNKGHIFWDPAAKCFRVKETS
jgi:hypothetical protein